MMPTAITWIILLSLGLTESVSPVPRSIPIWPDNAPGETTKDSGTELPKRDADNPPITRVEKITYPTMDYFPATHPNGTTVLILPGGGFRYVVTDLEGSEAAVGLNKLGIGVFVLRYRTSLTPEDAWKRPLQDSQRAIRWIRSHASEYGIDSSKVGLLGFSAGGQIAAIHLTQESAAYPSADSIDTQSYRPDFGVLVYPWRIYDAGSGGLVGSIRVSKDTPATLIVHTHDDASSSLGAVYMYAELKKKDVSSELHVYQNGGHGYGVRSRPNSMIGTWQNRMHEWLQLRGYANESR